MILLGSCCKVACLLLQADQVTAYAGKEASGGCVDVTTALSALHSGQAASQTYGKIKVGIWITRCTAIIGCSKVTLIFTQVDDCIL